jgi:hypothetical protein
MFTTKSCVRRISSHEPSSPTAIVIGSKRVSAPRPARMPAAVSAEFFARYWERASAWKPTLTPSTAR